jgi:uncharacterized membrane protein YdjX (TVP38/TMEM64 family)
MSQKKPPATFAAAALDMARRYVLLILVIAAIVVVAWLHPENYVSPANLAAHRAGLVAWIGQNFAASLGVYFVVYVVSKVAFVPGGPVLTALAGLFLGVAASGIVSTIAGTLAGAIVYEAATHSVGQGLRQRALPFVERIGAAFRRNGFGYVLTLRLIPVVPFWLASLVPAILGVRRAPYLIATFLGNIPSSFLYASLGGAVGALLDQGKAVDLAIVGQVRVWLPLLGLAALSLAPALYARISGRELFRAP